MSIHEGRFACIGAIPRDPGNPGNIKRGQVWRMGSGMPLAFDDHYVHSVEGERVTVSRPYVIDGKLGEERYQINRSALAFRFTLISRSNDEYMNSWFAREFQGVTLDQAISAVYDL